MQILDNFCLLPDLIVDLSSVLGDIFFFPLRDNYLINLSIFVIENLYIQFFCVKNY